jgi:hypothetical protein
MTESHHFTANKLQLCPKIFSGLASTKSCLSHMFPILSEFFLLVLDGEAWPVKAEGSKSPDTGKQNVCTIILCDCMLIIVYTLSSSLLSCVGDLKLAL